MKGAMDYYDQDGRHVIIGEGAIDWFTLTTYDGDQVDIAEQQLIKAYGKSFETVSISGGYIGFKYAEYVVLLKKNTREATHFVVHASAIHSDEMLRRFITTKGFDITRWKCTRIDIQITLHKRPRRRSLNSIGTDLKSGKFGKISNRRKIEVDLRSSETGDTIYIGSAKSEKRRRIYTKFLSNEDGNNEELERYEIQYRHLTAVNILKRVISEGAEGISTNIQKLIKGDASILPEPFIRLLAIDKFQPKMKGVIVNRARKESKTTNTTKWLRSLRYAILKACNQEGSNGLFCRETILEALVISITENPIENWSGWRLTNVYGEIVGLDKVWYDSEVPEHTVQKP